MQDSGLKLPIYDITSFTLLDFPELPACIIWIAGCNMRCSYCHNPGIVFGKGRKSVDDVKKFLKSRKNLLEGVVISGGECTLYKDIVPFCQMVKEMGFKVKVDTNASNFEILKELADNNLVDFFAIDFKAPKEKYKAITGYDGYENLLKSIKYLIQKKIKFEVRTTVHTSLLDKHDIMNIAKILHSFGYSGKYCIQNFRISEKMIGELDDQMQTLDISSLNLPVECEFRNF
ncbi:anaerobic ribonucleoside-triphosphate reductase activating protein [Nitrosophilus alvini]|uniref:anaerobic ribonucleoside-triphosphate reductase activating protein n=1 Tax=Nitrosophilus alvini TaxID=2714855 RepID=UPI00190913EF|nr:anaerobic ribonucleoside-triphosphate reductase activating protein [Nitrosophilus alvini]